MCKYIVPEGYPKTKFAGHPIKINEKEISKLGVKLYYASVTQKNNKIYMTSSRSLGLVAEGDSIYKAERLCEKATNYVEGKVYHRRDIGTRELIEKRIEHMNSLRKE